MKTKILLIAIQLIIVITGFSQNNTNLGTNAGNAGAENVSVGYVAGDLVTGSFNSFVGSNAGAKNTSGSSNSFMGYESGNLTTTGGDNSFYGTNSGYANTTGGQNVFLGSTAGTHNVDGFYNVYVGYRAGTTCVSGDRNTFIGHEAGYTTTADDNTFVGYYSGRSITTGNLNTFIGVNAGETSTTGSSNTATGYQALYLNTTASYNSAFGQEALHSNTGASNSAFGFKSLYLNTSGANNAAGGYQSLYNNTTASYNTAFGQEGLYTNTTGANNSATGYRALYLNTSGSSNTAEGYQALYSNTSASYNTASGREALYSNTTGYKNTGVGYKALYTNTTGYKNTALGYQANVSSAALTNATAIGYNASVTASNSIQLGNDSTTQVFIGTGTTATLITGGLKVTGGTIASGKVLTSDASGVATWQTLPSSGGSWSLSGNSGTVDGTNFIGTTDNVPFNIRVNNYPSGRIDQASADTFYGLQAGQSNTTGTHNSAIGNVVLADNTTGAYNTGTGSQALLYNSTGSDNTASGFSALMYNTTGHDNTTMGHLSLVTNITGSFNTALGRDADVNSSALSNATALGYGAVATASNKVRIGNSSVTVIEGQVAWSSPSDGRFKKDIKEDIAGLNFINALRPVSYVVDKDSFDKFIGVPDSLIQKQAAFRKNPSRENGFIAQEVDQLVKKNGYIFHGVVQPTNEKDNYGIRYSEFVVPLVKAVQELSSKLDDQNKFAQGQQKIIDDQQKTIDELLRKVNGNKTNTTTSDEAQIELFQNAPNPFTEDTQINMTLPETVKAASVIVYNLEGKQINAYEVHGRGKASVKISGNELGAGMYIYALIADNKVIDTRRMILTK